MGEQSTRLREPITFTFDWYGDFLDHLIDAGYADRSFGDDLQDGDVVIRHDVDLSLADAVTMAILEWERDIHSTYCILLSTPLYNSIERKHREQIRAIESLGHDIALHFSTHEYWGPQHEPEESSLLERIEAERQILGTLTAADIETVSFHVPPEWVLDRSFETFTNTYAPAYFGDIGYIADSKQRWRDEPPVLESLPAVFQMLTHPGLWAETDGPFQDRVERSIEEACNHAEGKAHGEFLAEEMGQ